jgi:hypothetical protein
MPPIVTEGTAEEAARRAVCSGSLVAAPVGSSFDRSSFFGRGGRAVAAARYEPLSLWHWHAVDRCLQGR